MFVSWLKELWRKFTESKIDEYFGCMDRRLDKIVDTCEKIDKKLDSEIELLTKEVHLYRGMVHAIAEALPDMVWFKDVDGKYIYANQAIKDGLLLEQNPIGKNDVELATKAKWVWGNENHTFGEKCRNSDVVVLENLRKQKFLESGKVKGNMLYLEVYKAPFFVDGVLKGVVGAGRDMTDYVHAYEKSGCKGCNVFKIHEFEPDE